MYGGRCAALTRRPQAGRRLRALLRLTAPSPPRRKSPRRTVRLVAMVLDEVRGDAPVPAAVLDKLEERYLRPIEYAAHAVFAAEFEDLIDPLLGFDGPLAQRLQAVQEAAPLRVPSHVVLRELLSLTLVHSKSLVPASLLDDRDALRNLIQRAVLTDLETHRVADEALSAHGAHPFVASANADWYESPLEDSFAWLTSQDVAHRSLADDVLDALRLLRVADALRQRGTSLR